MQRPIRDAFTVPFAIDEHPRHGSISSRGKSKRVSCQQGDSCQIETKGGPFLPMEIWCHIHSLMPLLDAARSACMCHAFLCAWKTRPNLIFSNETLGVNESALGKAEVARAFISKVDRILKNHFGSLKTLKLLSVPNYNAWYYRYLDSWLQMAVTPQTEELTLTLAEHFTGKKYKFPSSILLNGNGDSLRYLSLEERAFHPTVGLGCLKNLAKVELFFVYIKGDELGYLLSNALALESLDLSYCCEIVCVRIPCLKRLSHLSVIGCSKLQVIKSKAPSLSSFHFGSAHRVSFSIGEALQVKKLYVDCSSPVCYSRAEVVSSMPNLETLAGHSGTEMINTRVASGKFVYLEVLSVILHGIKFSESFDYLSVVPQSSQTSVEAFILDVSQRLMGHPNFEKIRSFSVANPVLLNDTKLHEGSYSVLQCRAP